MKFPIKTLSLTVALAIPGILLIASATNYFLPGSVSGAASMLLGIVLGSAIMTRLAAINPFGEY